METLVGLLFVLLFIARIPPSEAFGALVVQFVKITSLQTAYPTLAITLDPADKFQPDLTVHRNFKDINYL